MGFDYLLYDIETETCSLMGLFCFANTGKTPEQLGNVLLRNSYSLVLDRNNDK
ncbi:MAG: hypothetical protein TR69_WS6001000254 [candidate division WS6 bacterium OLB20]|uniref:Uncharacterized protein n=1 Tax=candidate division WS6 bacterium OLB20 TaxID=1617426 RepID=A0A136M0E5_9BACT|nr:MAG: hypothetical protein TR69_WS6001000254 [candidate division WS6 bacterium OLB20]